MGVSIACYRVNSGELWGRCNVISKYKYAIWNRRFYAVGSFEIALSDDCGIKPNDIVRMDNLSGIVMKTDTSAEGTVIYGYDLKGLAARRMTTEKIVTAGANVEEEFISLAITLLNTDKKKIEGMKIAAAKGIAANFSEETQISAQRLSDVFEAYGTKYGVGWDIVWQPISRTKNEMLFTCLSPTKRRDMSVSTDNRNITRPHRITDIYDACNSTAENKNTEASGTELYEGTQITSPTDCITGEATAQSSEFSLGDIVTVRVLSTEAELQVTQMQYIYEQNRHIIVPTFGESKKNIIKKLMGG